MKTKSNPFRFGSAVSGDQYYDRAEVGDALYRAIAGGSSNVVLYAPRRYGKTSLVKQAIERWADDGFVCIYFDMMKVDSVETFCEKYAAAVHAACGRSENIIRLLGSLLSRLRPKLSVDESGSANLELDIASRRFTVSDLEDVLNLPERMFGGKRTVAVIFDEFQEISEMSGDIPLEGAFRGCIQHHRSVRYVFLGSKTHLLKRMFGSHSRPFYNSARILHLDKPSEDESRVFVKSRFASVGIKAPDAQVERILKMTRNIPYYLQALSSEAYEVALARGGKSISAADVAAATASLGEMRREQYEMIMDGLSVAQRHLLCALAEFPVRRFDDRYRRRYGLGQSSTVHGALEKLVNKGHVEKTDEGYSVGDPFFARYLTAKPYEVMQGHLP